MSRPHPRDHEIIAATHGRGIWIADISALQQIDEKVIAEDAHLFSSPTAIQFGDPPVEGQSQGHRSSRFPGARQAVGSGSASFRRSASEIQQPHSSVAPVAASRREITSR
jgi:hypothetical protein